MYYEQQLPQHRFSGLHQVDQIGIQLHQEKDSTQRRLGHLASQRERQVSFRSETLGRGFIEIHQRLNNCESSTTTTGYVEW
jgi:hypothetical protein